MLAVTRYVQAPAGMQTYGGEEVREQTVYFELTPNGRNLLLKSDILYNHADTLDAIAKSVNNSSANPILHIFKLVRPKDTIKSMSTPCCSPTTPSRSTAIQSWKQAQA